MVQTNVTEQDVERFAKEYKENMERYSDAKDPYHREQRAYWQGNLHGMKQALFCMDRKDLANLVQYL